MNQVHVRRVIPPLLLAQQQDSFPSIPWLTSVMWFISCKLPSSSPPCKDEGFEQCLAVIYPLCSTLTTCSWLQIFVYGELFWNWFQVCEPHSIHETVTIFWPIISILLQLPLGCKSNFSVSSNCLPHSSFHTEGDSCNFFVDGLLYLLREKCCKTGVLLNSAMSCQVTFC